MAETYKTDGTEKEIPNVNNPLMRFFSQDPVNADLTSFSIGDVWLYMYRETMVGFIHMESREGWFMDWKEPLFNDGFSSQHLLTKDHVKACVEDTMIDHDKIHYLEHGELVAHAFKAVCDECVARVDEAMFGKKG